MVPQMYAKKQNPTKGMNCIWSCANALMAYIKLKITIMGGREQKITDENIKDTLLDMANYCLMELVEMTVDANGADKR